MATEFPSDDSPAVARSGPVTRRELVRRLRRPLEALLAAPRPLPSFDLIGFGRSVTEVIDHHADQPEQALLGFSLPPQFFAIGVIAPSVVATPPQRSHRNAALALGATRDGHVVSLLGTTDEIVETHEPQGWLVDACLRSLGQPTDPCVTAALEFPIVLWLDRIMIAIVNTSQTGPVTWADVVELCPVPSGWRSFNPVDLGTTLGSTTPSWAALRAGTTQGTRAPVGVRPRWAAWMDDAMFARWCMGSFPERANLRADVEFLASDDVAQQLDTALRAAWLAFAN